MSSSVDANRVVPLETLVNRARAILPMLPPKKNCNERCRANRASDQALLEVHGERSDWSLYSQYIPLLVQALGCEMDYRQLAEELTILNATGCTNDDIQQVASKQFDPLCLSAAALDALGYLIRSHVGQYVVSQLIKK